MTADAIPGLTAAEAARRLAAEGPNSLPQSRQAGVWGTLLAVLREPMFLLLMRCATWSRCTCVPAAAIFRFAAPGLRDVALAAACGAASVLWYDLYKIRRRRQRG